MTRITGTTYKCDQCQKEEHDEKQVLCWLTVGILRDQIAPQRGGIVKAVRHIEQRWDFCSKECLAQWSMNKTP